MFAILVVMALLTTFMTTPAVMAIYKPARHSPSAATHPKARNLTSSVATPSDRHLRILACVHGPGNVPSLISLVDSIRRADMTSVLKLFVLHLVELSERSSSILRAQRACRNGIPFFARSPCLANWQDHVADAFQGYNQLGRVTVRPSTTVSPLSTMHEDICQLAEEKRVAMILLPFHKRWWRSGGEDEVEVVVEENAGYGWRGVNERVLRHAPCSVGVMVDQGFGDRGTRPGPAGRACTKSVCVMFFGGPDDREALELAGRMADHPCLKVRVVRFEREEQKEEGEIMVLRSAPSKSREKHYSFSIANINWTKEKELDDAVISEFRARWGDAVDYEEKTASNIAEEILAVGRSSDNHLIIVGKGRFPSRMVAELADLQAEHAELGPVADILTSSGNHVVSPVLVIQQHDTMAQAEDTPVTRVESGDQHNLRVDADFSVVDVPKDQIP